MTGAAEHTTPRGAPDPPRKFLGPGTVLAGVALVLLIAFGYCASRVIPAAFLGRNETKITNDVVIQQVRAVAKLV
ncbi:MAG TPA: hypothetical protein VGO75_13485, partial [Gemmatimonadaceae bacterium]|nr:hypothetical protein [Gemmatimonadaceae bacterium]